MQGMPMDKEFISTVRAEPLLLHRDRELSETDARKAQDLWKHIAREFSLESADKAKDKWQQLVADYIMFLRHGGNFCYAQQMEFMQYFLLSAEERADITQSDSELDEFELQNVLNSDEDAVQLQVSAKPNKKRKVAAADQDCETETPKNLDAVYTPASASINSLSSMELIFLGYAKVLQRMPLALQLQTKRKIAEVMDEAEVKLLELK